MEIYSLIDPATLTTMDAFLTACTGIDALVHAVEAYVSLRHSPLTEEFSMKLRYNAKDLLFTSFFIAIFICTPFFLSGCKKEQKAAPPPVVEVVAVVQKDVPIYKEWVGALDGYVNAVIRPQVTGYLIKQNYHEGELVKKGRMLFEIDPRTFQAALDKAKGALEEAKSDLARQEALWITAKANLVRIEPLAAKNAVSQRDLDNAIGLELATKAAAGAARASIASAQAAVETAQLNLGFTEITSPVDGIAGIAKAQLGDLVGPSMQTELTAVSTVDPIKAYINLSEQEYLKIRESNPDTEKIPLELILADGSVYPHKGHVALADRQIDPTTGTLRVGTLFANPGNILRPGGYGLVRAIMSVRKGALLIPQRAVTDLQGKYLVAVVGPDNKVDIRPVKVAERIGSDWIIAEGLKPRETVVVEGIQKVKPGMQVTTKPYSPEAPAAPPTAAKPETKPIAQPAEKR
jgi:membrane fusion protein (multidrug efflux system)